MRKSFALVGTAAAALGLSVLASGTANADILPAIGNPTVVANGDGTFNYTYEVFVTSTQRVQNGNSFTFYDFNGFTGVAFASSADFTFSASPTSPPVTTPFGSVTPNEDNAPNVMFTYNGAATILGGPTSLGTFTLQSTLGTFGLREAFVGQGTDRDTNIVNANITNYVAPVPEPGEYAVAGIFAAGLIGLMVRARRRSREGGMAPA